MADENRMATFEWLSNNMSNYVKAGMNLPNTKKCVTKSEVLTYLNVDETRLTQLTNSQLVRRSLLIGVDNGGGDPDPEPNPGTDLHTIYAYMSSLVIDNGGGGIGSDVPIGGDDGQILAQTAQTFILNNLISSGVTLKLNKLRIVDEFNINQYTIDLTTIQNFAGNTNYARIINETNIRIGVFIVNYHYVMVVKRLLNGQLTNTLNVYVDNNYSPANHLPGNQYGNVFDAQAFKNNTIYAAMTSEQKTLYSQIADNIFNGNGIKVENNGTITTYKNS